MTKSSKRGSPASTDGAPPSPQKLIDAVVKSNEAKVKKVFDELESEGSGILRE